MMLEKCYFRIYFKGNHDFSNKFQYHTQKELAKIMDILSATFQFKSQNQTAKKRETFQKIY